MRIATLNIGGFDVRYGAWAQRRARIVAQLRILAPDVALLQAVGHDTATGENQAAELARAAGYEQVEFAAAPQTSLGTAMLYSRPLQVIRHTSLGWLPNPEDGLRRVIAVAQMTWRGQTLQIVNAHLSWVAALNEQQAAETVATLRETGAPVVLGGDLNARPDSGGTAVFREAGLVDTWAALRAQEPGGTFPADRPDRRIDYLWVSPVLTGSLVRIERFGTEAPLSDHLGLLLTLEEG